MLIQNFYFIQQMIDISRKGKSNAEYKFYEALSKIKKDGNDVIVISNTIISEFISLLSLITQTSLYSTVAGFVFYIPPAPIKKYCEGFLRMKPCG